MNEPDLTGWYAGLVIGAVAILAVVVLVTIILALARAAGSKSREIALTLRQARSNTGAMPDVMSINVEVHQINARLADLRRNLDTIYPEARGEQHPS
ncbi:hypothetical protein ACIA03_23410 [Nocardioides sp. NPDC051685]|uniref:hypothetical protein n=1 Tax=Nocardioides sp. NPDC051685 TaxID=3364334 RepID=UPI0037A9AEE8